MNELELCKKIAEIEGLAVADPGVVSSREYNESTCLIIPHGKHSPYSYVYSPLTNKALLFDLQIKHGVVVKPHSGGFTDVFIDDYKILVVCATEDEIPRAILECILEANSGKAK